MGGTCVWIISLIAASLIGIASSQGTCKYCGKYTKDENCSQPFISPYPIDDMMCQMIANNQHIETAVCAEHKSGYRIICKTRNTDSTAEVLYQRCEIACPAPKVIKERFHGNGVSRVPQSIGAVAGVVLVGLVTVRRFIC